MNNRDARKLVDSICAVTETMGYRKTLGIEGLDMALAANEPALVDWVLKYLQPLSLTRNEQATRSIFCACVHSDDLVKRCIQYLSCAGLTTFERLGKDDRILACARISSTMTLYCDQGNGVAWLTDFSSDSIHLLFSSRTRQPALDFARTVRNTVVAYLQNENWVSYHAGAVEMSHGVVMIVGDSGAGKTSLITALMKDGARYVANERLLVKEEASGVRALGYPMAIAIGLGTLMQFRELDKLIDSPETLLYPTNRFSRRRVRRTPVHARHELHDKLQFLPEELSEHLNCPQASPGGIIEGVVVPSVSRTDSAARCISLEPDYLQKSLSRNFMGIDVDPNRPQWVCGPTPKPDAMAEHATISLLAKVKSVEFQYSLIPARRPGMFSELMESSLLQSRGSSARIS